MVKKSSNKMHHATSVSICLSLGLIAYLCLFCLTSTVHADAVTTGDVSPTNLAHWNWYSDAYIGKTSNGTLTVTSGPTLLVDTGFIGYESGASGVLKVDGTGAVFASKSGSLIVGDSGKGIVNIINGGRTFFWYGIIGNKGGSTGEVTVGSSGSRWRNEGDLLVGNYGSGKLNINSGGEVVVDRDTMVSFRLGSSGAIHFDHGKLTTNSFLGACDDLFGTGTINTKGIISDVDLVFDATHGFEKTFNINKKIDQNILINLTVNSDGSYRAMGAGYGGTGTMRIADGKEIKSFFGYVGFKSGSDGAVTVDGIGSKWESEYWVIVGTHGRGTLDIINGGVVKSRDQIIGHKANSTGIVTIDGVGSEWGNGSGDFIVGNSGNGTLNITNGGLGRAGYGYIGESSHSTGHVTVDGTNSKWSFYNDLTVGNSGNATLNITNGGVVESGNSFIGKKSGSSGVVTVHGTNSRWMLSELTVSDSGNSRLNITEGSLVTVDKTTWVSRQANSSGMIHFDNGTLVTGAIASALDNLTGTGTINTKGLISDINLVFDSTHGLNQTFHINKKEDQNITINLNIDGSGLVGAGYEGLGTMRIADGRVIESTNGYVGYKSSSTGIVTVDGVGSTWTNSDVIFAIGVNGTGSLNIINGGSVNNQGGSSIGLGSGSIGVVTVDGAGSTWHINETNTDHFYIGDKGHGILNIIQGGTVINEYGYISNETGSRGVVTVDGSGSSWTVGKVLYIGHGTHTGGRAPVDNSNSDNPETPSVNNFIDNNGNGTLNIINGSSVHSERGFIASALDSIGLVVVDGTESKWMIQDYFYIGGSGHGTLNITGGGTVSNQSGYIGTSTDSIGIVTVDGNGSIWMNSGDMYVGQYDRNNSGGGGGRAPEIVGGDAMSSLGDNSNSTQSSGGMLNITGGGLVRVDGTLTIDREGIGDSFINMASDGMLALHGDADDLLINFLELIEGTDAIRYWDDSTSAWAALTDATYGVDYTLSYQIEGDLAGYTVLTVPEPATLVLLGLGGLISMRHRHR